MELVRHQMENAAELAVPLVVDIGTGETGMKQNRGNREVNRFNRWDSNGKTTVSRLLQGSGVPVIDADAVYSKLSEKGNRVWEVIHQAFGEKFSV